MSAIDQERFPKGALIAAGALISFSLIITGVARVEHLNAGPATGAATQPPTESIDVRFSDEPDGSVSVRDSHTDKVVASLAPDTNAFVRSVMRGLVHERKRQGFDAGPPFRISQWASGRLALEDTATGRLIDLDAFGVTNKDAFAQILPARRTTS